MFLINTFDSNPVPQAFLAQNMMWIGQDLSRSDGAPEKKYTNEYI